MNIKNTTIEMLIIFIALFSISSFVNAQWSSPVQVTGGEPKKFIASESFQIDNNGKIHVTYKNWTDGIPDIWYATNLSGSWTRTKVLTADVPILTYNHLSNTLAITYNPSTQQNANYVIEKPVVGGSWSAPTRIDQNPYNGYLVESVTDNTGGLLHSWAHLFDDNWNPRSGTYSRYRPHQGSFGSTEFIAGSNGDYWIGPGGYIGMKSFNNDIYVYYKTNGLNGARYKVRSGGVWGPEKLIYNNAYGCHMAQSPTTGELAAVWGNPSESPQSDLDWDIYASFSNDNGATWSTPIKIFNNTELTRTPTAYYDSKGNFHVAFQSRDSQWDKFKTRYVYRVGALWQPMEQIDTLGLGSNPIKKAFGETGGNLYIFYNEARNIKYRTKPMSTDNIPPGPVTNFTATGGENRIFLNWKNPSASDFAATMIRYSPTAYPTGPFKGTEACLKIASPGSNDAYTIYPLPHNTTYYFSAYAQDYSGNWSLVANAVGTTAVDVTPPANVTQFTVEPYTTKDLILRWKNPNDLDFKGTMIRFKTTGFPTSKTDGTLLVSKDAVAGSNDSYIHSNLVAGQTYYYRAFSYDYSNLYSSGVNASGVPVEMSCLDAKLLPDNSPVSLVDKVVSGIFPSESAVYILEKDGSSGIRLYNNGSGLNLGDRVNVSGVVTTRKPDGSTPSEREIQSAQITKLGSSYTIKPFGMGNYAVGGGAIPPYVPGVTSAPVGGVFTPAVGLNTMGMFVKIYGTVTKVISSGFYVDDGSNILDISNRLGILVTAPDSNIPVQVGYVVSVSGIVKGNIPSGWPTNRRNIIMRSWSDLTIHYSGPQPGVITGTVTSSLGGPVSGATISTNIGGYTTTSLSDGTFSIPNVTAGTYDVTATANGYTSDIYTGVVVEEGGTVNLAFVLTPTTGSISGYVRDSNNQPISGATISTNSGGYTTTSASNGSYTLSNVAPGTYSVTASKTGYSNQTNNNITVNVGQTATSNFNLTSIYGILTGVVKDNNGNGVVGATVSTSSGGYSTVSGTGGAYTLSNISPGTYTVTASKANYHSDTKTNISITAGNTTTQNFTIIPKTGAISGTVLNFSGNPVVGAVVTTNTGGYSTTSGSGGAYTLSNVLIGTYSVTASASGYQNQTVSNVSVQENQTTTVNFNLNPTATNKVTNGDFSSGSFSFWGGKMGNGWGAAWTSNGSGSNGSWDIKNDTYGNCQKASSSANGVGIGIAQEISGLTPGASYTFTAQGKKTVTNYTLYMGVAQGTGHGSVIPITGTAFPSGTGWQSKTITGNVGSTGSVTIYVWGVRDSGSTSDILFDNITFTSF